MDSTSRLLNRSNLLLSGILLMALAVRLFGIHHGLPYGYQIDEKFVVNHAIGFGTGDLNPHTFHWPGTSLMYLVFFEYGLLFVAGWIFGFFGSAMDFAELFVVNPSIFYLIGRITIVLMGTGTLVLLYQFARRIYNKEVGLIAVTFYAFSYLAVGIDHMVLPDTPLTFLCVLAMLLLNRIMIQGRTKTYLWAGLVIGLAISTKYSGGALILPLLIAHFYQVSNETKLRPLSLVDKRLGLALLMIALGFVISCPFSILDFSTFSQDLLWQFKRVHSGSFGTDVENAWAYYLIKSMPFSLGIGLTILSVMGFIYAVIRHKREDMPVTLFILFYFLYIGSWDIGVDKYLLPILPFLTLLAARFISEIFSKFGKLSPMFNRLFIPIILLLIAGPFARSIHNDYLLTQKDTRTRAKEWIEAHIPDGVTIAIDAGNFDVAKLSPPLNETKESLTKKYLQKEREFPETWSQAKNKVSQYFQIKMKYLKGRTYNLIHIVPNVNGEIDKEVNLERFRKKGVKYVVASSYAYSVYKDPIYKRRHSESARFYNDFYASLDSECTLVKEFHPLTKSGSGPIIRIFKVQ